METKNSFISSASVKVQGRTAYYKMLEAVRQGELIQVCRGVYANIDQLSACMVDIESIVPNGILCLWSAWNIHQLTTSMPQAYHVAIKRDRKVKVPSFPKIELHHYTSNILEIGVMENITALQILSQDKLAVSDMLAFIYDEQPSEEDFIKEMARMCEANSWDTIG